MQKTNNLWNNNSHNLRNLTNTKEDFDRLARVFNTFKDPESWPGGFGGTRIFSGEYLKEYLNIEDFSTHFVVTAPDDENKIVGVSFLSKAWNIPNAFYVQLIGVDPEYQGKKIGKALLLRSTEYVISKKARIIGLHTWGGNLKAMPLYKRQGYKWRPNTSVYMENYIPVILSFPFFQEFFSKSNESWYDCFCPFITQEPDDTLDKEMYIYEYKFKRTNESLTVWIDRTIGKISGFHLVSNGLNLLIKANTPKSEAFVGIDEFKINFEVSNRSSNIITIINTVESSSTIELFNVPKNESLIVQPLNKQAIEINGKFLPNTHEFDMKIHSHTLHEEIITFNCKIEGISFSLSVGKVPVKPIKIETNPVGYNIKTSQSYKVPFTVKNFLGVKKYISLELSSSENIAFTENQKNLNLDIYDSEISFEASVKNVASSVENLNFKARDEMDQILSEEELPVLVFVESKALSYEWDQQIFLENKSTQIRFYKKAQPGSNEVYITHKTKGLQILGFPIVLGYPLDHESTEFYTKPHEHKLIESNAGLWLESTAYSSKKPGITVIRKILLPHDDEPISVKWEVINTTSVAMSNLAIRVHSYGLGWPGAPQVLRRVFPFQEGIKHLEINAFSIDLGKDPKMFKEGWQATVFPSGAFGILFDLENVEKITSGRVQPNIDLKLPVVNPMERWESKPTYYYFSDTWQSVRKKWTELYTVTPEKEIILAPSTTPLKKMGITTNSNKNVYRSLIVDHTTTELDFIIDAFRETVYKGSAVLSHDMINDQRIDINFDEKKGRFFRKKVMLKPLSSPGNIKSGKLLVDTLTRIYEYPIALNTYNGGQTVSVNRNDTEAYYQVNNNMITFRGSEKYRGNVFYLSLNSNKDNLLHTGKTTFPDIQPYLWYNKFYGGIGAIVHPANRRGEEEYNTLCFDPYQINRGKWVGFGFKSTIIDYLNTLKGIQVATEFLTLPEVPFLLVQTHIHNHSGVTRDISINIDNKLKTAETTEDFYYIHDPKSASNYLKYRMQDWESSVWLERAKFPKWAAYKGKSQENYIVALQPTTVSNEYIYPYSPNVKFMMLMLTTKKVPILPKSTITFRSLLVITDELGSITPLTDSNILDTLDTSTPFLSG